MISRHVNRQDTMSTISQAAPGRPTKSVALSAT
jgi:hypothetical protein